MSDYKFETLQLHVGQEQGHGRKFCVSDIRQSQEWRCGNRAKIGLNPLRTITPEVRSGMRASA